MSSTRPWSAANHTSSTPYQPFANAKSSWADQFDILGSRCSKLYLDHIYFGLPVLDAPRLLQSWRSGKAPFPPDSLLHHALVAATASWFTKDILDLEGSFARDELVDHHIEKFKKLLAISSTQSSLEQTQALLLAISAMSERAASATCTLTSEWLGLVVSSLRQPEPKPARSHSVLSSSLRRRVWWTAYILEKTHHLRHTFEDGKAFPSPRFELHASDGDSISVEDFNLDMSTTSEGFQFDYWSRMQRALLFMQKKTLFEYMAEVVVEYPWQPQSQSRLLMPPPPPRGHMRHDEYFWRVHSLLEQFEQFSAGSSVCEMGDVEDGGSSQGVAQMQLDLYLTFGRVLVVLCQAPFHTSGCNTTSSLWKDMRHTMLIKVIRRVLDLVRDTLHYVCTGSLPAAFSQCLLRPSIVCSSTLVSISPSRHTTTLEMLQLREKCRQVLETSLRVNGHAPAGNNQMLDLVSSRQNGPELSSAPSTTTDIRTPASVSAAPTQGDATIQVWREELMTEEQELLSSFDGMWNKHLVTARSPSFLHHAEGELG